ncbi:helix-turn-helix transcriptional regulator [Arthrobacter sp. AETb3-4]|uniref:Helix-turn-helix transcriptional regulator n=1 Tax=Arthrobacter wenxiniae TaxID=2713570 RepID=A0A7Y7LZB8_9MICC|nr:helix-turn-helix transcriptional regulator [Arthrobacter wenxiniae]
MATAREQFSANGHSATTIESLATGAGVAIQTIYNPVGNQPALPAAALDAASGPDAPATVPESCANVPPARPASPAWWACSPTGSPGPCPAATASSQPSDRRPPPPSLPWLRCGTGARGREWGATWRPPPPSAGVAGSATG